MSESEGKQSGDGQPQALIPLEEKQVDFYGDSITAALVRIEPGQGEQVYVPIRPICEYLGLDWSAQYRRLKRHPVLNKVQGVAMMTTPGGQQQAICLPLKFLPGWLFGLESNRMKSELKPKIIRYQEECYDILAEAFQHETTAVTDLDAVDPFAVEQVDLPANPVLLQIREMGLAIARMAEEQITLQKEVGRAHSRLDVAGQLVSRLQKRMNSVERIVLPGAPISPVQAASISQAVKTLAEFLTSKEPGKVHYQSIFSELYRRFGVYNYREIRQTDYAEVLTFLDDWRKAAGNKTDQPPPAQALI